jgi:hypothetical protein
MSWLRTSTASLTTVLFMSLGVFPAAARAGSVTYAAPYSLSPYLSSGPYAFGTTAFPKFDVPGGCLTSVCVKLDGLVTGSVGLENYDNFPKTLTSTFTAKIELTRPDLTPLVAVQPAIFNSDPVTAFDGAVDYAGTSGLTHSDLLASVADSLCMTDAANLALFSGAGTISLPCTATNLSTQGGANSWSFAIRAAASAMITYTYTDCAVPARPATWGRLKSLYR